MNKNIVVYNDDNGNKLSSGEEFELKLRTNNGYEKIDVNEYKHLGKYEIATSDSDTKLRSIDGSIYLYKMSEGEYILEGDNGSVSTFTIDEDGNLTGNIRTTYVDTDFTSGNNILASSEADMIVNYQTGNMIIRYSFITIIISLILFIMFLIKKKSKKLI